MQKNLNRSDEYRTVTCTLQMVRAESIMVEVAKLKGWRSIPRSLIYGPDDLALEKMRKGSEKLPIEHTFRVLAWQADELHLS